MNFYKEVAGILDKLDAKRGSIQSNLSSVAEANRKRTAALVIETLKYRSVLTSIIDATPLLQQEKRHIPTRTLALVLVHDLLLTKGGIQASDGPIKQAVLRHQTRLRAELVKAKVKRGVKENAQLAQDADPRARLIPRYVRVNLNAWSMDDALEYFASRGLTCSPSSDDVPGPKCFQIDPHVPSLLAFNPNLSFHDDPVLKQGKIILQDKASCFPAIVLAPPHGAKVVDATAAPGNKTGHLSAAMGNTGKIIAFERDHRRYETLQTMVEKAHCSNVTATHRDFLSVDPTDELFKDVTHILLDPSCSGSGIVNRMDYLVETEEESSVQEARLEKLAAFQLMMIKHAMKVKSAIRIVYSTCSIHVEENEHVVRDALKSEEAVDAGFVLAGASEVLPAWPRRGLSTPSGLSEDLAASVIRCSPGEDHTNGFFVACFIRQNVDALSQPEKNLSPKEVSKRKRKDSERAGSVLVVGDVSERPKKKKKKKHAKK